MTAPIQPVVEHGSGLLKLPTVGELIRMVSAIVQRRQLIYELAKRDITDRYSGQALGSFWAFGHPALQLAVYVFVFNFVFRAKVDSGGLSSQDYVTYILSGLIPWLTLQEIINRSATVLVAHSNLVKQTVLPLEVLPLKVVLSALGTQLVSMVGLVLYVGLTQRGLSPSYLLLPIVIVLQILFVVGAAFVLSALTVFVRDLKDAVLVFSYVGVYLVPVVYSPAWVPALVRPLLYLNPFSHLAWCFQDVIFYCSIQHPVAWVVTAVFSVWLFAVGYRLFHRLRPLFGRVL